MAEIWAGEELSNKPTKTIDELCEKIATYYPNADFILIRKAYKFSESVHAGQMRRSGEPYIVHPLGVAGILADLRLDLSSIITGLLHDTIEDTTATLDVVKKEFGSVIANLVDGVTKISQIQFKSRQEKQGENIRKMIVAMGKDVRVILVKLCDRLHNMRTLSHMPYEKQILIAQETLDIYAPLASRLGISTVKIELEDLSFRFSNPEAYYNLVQTVVKKKKEREKYIDDVKKILLSLLQKNKVNGLIQGRPKHFFSIYRKMVARKIEYEQVYDLLAFRILTNSLSDCYEVLGLVHSLWKPVPGRFKDFIAMPKANNYQSLHSTVIGPGGERIEIQIRTHEMHLVAERGIAAHWKYKENNQVDAFTQEKFKWLRELISWHQQMRDPDEFLEVVKTDLFESVIYVFTPKGDVKEFPDGSTPIDFAYSVHTDLGHRCTGARVNGRLVPLKYRFKNGDTIEILTSSQQTPNKDWLKFCVTNRAKTKIRAYIKEEQRKRAQILGADMCEKAFRRIGLTTSKILKGPLLEDYLRKQGLRSLDMLYAKVGYGKVLPRQVVDAFAAESASAVDTITAAQPQLHTEKTFLERIVTSALNKKKPTSIIKVTGADDILIKFGKCCNPIPGDPIRGFITRGRGITVHRADCEKSFEVDQERKVDVTWSNQIEDVVRVARIRIDGYDQPGLLKNISETFALKKINVHNAQIRTTKDKKAVFLFDVNVKDTKELSSVIHELQRVSGVIGVNRVTRL